LTLETESKSELDDHSWIGFLIKWLLTGKYLMTVQILKLIWYWTESKCRDFRNCI